MESSAAATWLSAWVSTPPVIARVSTMVNAIPFLCVEGWHAPAGRRTCETPASSPGQADQTGRAGGCRETLDPGRQIVAQDNPSGVSRFGGQAGTQAPGPTPAPPQNHGSRAGSTTHTLPADSGAGLMPDRRLALTVDARPTGHWTRGRGAGGRSSLSSAQGHRITTQEPRPPEVACVACAAASGWR